MQDFWQAVVVGVLASLISAAIIAGGRRLLTHWLGKRQASGQHSGRKYRRPPQHVFGDRHDGQMLTVLLIFVAVLAFTYTLIGLALLVAPKLHLP